MRKLHLHSEKRDSRHWRFVLKLKNFFSFQMSPDGHFILDYHPTHKSIVIGAGMSGKLHAYRIFSIMKVQLTLELLQFYLIFQKLTKTNHFIKKHFIDVFLYNFFS